LSGGAPWYSGGREGEPQHVTLSSESVS